MLFFAPQIDLFAIEKLRLYARAFLPALIYVRSEAYGEITLYPGIRAGARSAEWIRSDSPMSRAYGILGLDLKLGKLTRLSLFVVIRGPISRSDVIQFPVLPGIGASWRLGGKKK